MRKICLIWCVLCICLIGCGSNKNKIVSNKVYTDNNTVKSQVSTNKTNDTQTNSKQINKIKMDSAQKDNAQIDNKQTNNTTQQVASKNETTKPQATTNEVNNTQTNSVQMDGTQIDNVPEQVTPKNRTEEISSGEVAPNDINKIDEATPKNGVIGSTNKETYTNVDIDLSSMGADTAYNNATAIMSNPEEYCGKVIKASGLLTVLVGDTSQGMYLACVVRDSSTLNAQGIEFQPYKSDIEGKNVKESEGDEITVVGTFDSYNVGDNTFYTLKDARILSME